jgi:hypothetical protein
MADKHDFVQRGLAQHAPHRCEAFRSRPLTAPILGVAN